VLRCDADNSFWGEHQTCEVPRDCMKPFPWDCGKSFFEELFNAKSKTISFADLEGIILPEEDSYLRL